MSSYRNKAIYLDSQGVHSVRTYHEPYVPQGKQSLVEVQYSAINPADTRHYYMGVSEYVSGLEFCGTVREVGEDAPFKPGQEVFGFALPQDRRPAHLGAHQDFLLAESFMTFERPPHLAPVTAVTLLAGALTAMDALFNPLRFALPAAGLDGDSANGVSILIWGGSSIVGQAGIQFANLAGFDPILTTASPRNYDNLKALGATHCFDYRSETVVNDIQALMQHIGKKLTVAFDAVAAGLGDLDGQPKASEREAQEEYKRSSAGMARQCCASDVPADELRLASALPVAQDPSWQFCLMFRTVEMMEHGTGAQQMSTAEREEKEAQTKRWGARLEQGTRWLIDQNQKYWKPPRARIVTSAEEGVQAIGDVWNGKTSMEKLVIQHPM